MEKNIKKGTWLIKETTELSTLEIAEGASISAPEGKYVTLTVDGVSKTIEPGVYEGSIVLTVSDYFTALSKKFQLVEDEKYRGAIFLKDGKYMGGNSVPAAVQDGKITGNKIENVTIKSQDFDFNGIYVGGEDNYEINNATIEFEGDGTNDFTGLGAGICCGGDSVVTVNDCNVSCKGITRLTAIVLDRSRATFNNCRLVFEGGTFYTDEELKEHAIRVGKPPTDNPMGRWMQQAPWHLELVGYGRATNLCGFARATYNNCYISTDGWGIFGIDSSTSPRLYLKDSTLEGTGDSCYGMFSIADDVMFDYKFYLREYEKYGCHNIVDHCVFNNITMPIIMAAGHCCGEYINGTVFNACRFGAMIFRADEATLKINSSSVINTDEATILVKGASASIELDDAKLNPSNGVILQLCDNDETGHTARYPGYLIPVGEVDEKLPDRDVTVADPKEDVIMTVSNMDTVGNYFNSTTALYANCRDDILSPKVPGVEYPEMPRGLGQVRAELRDLQGPHNLDISFSNAKVTGLITAATQHYAKGLKYIGKENYWDMSRILCDAAPVVNNGVIVSFDEKSVWTVTGTCYLSKLTVAEGTVITGANGHDVKMTVDGVKTQIAAGTYVGNIEITVQ